MTDWTVHHGDCLEVLRTLPDCIVDAVVTDPPYGLSFMGRKWDYDVPGVDVWLECLRVLKPGGHLLAFAGTRTQHRMCCRIEDAGFEIRDMIAWVYGSGFPKSLDVSKAIDKADGAEREALGIDPVRFARLKNQLAGSVSTGEQWKHGGRDVTITAPATDAARRWQGWGTALKPSLETVTFASKPYTQEQERDIIQSNLIRLEARLWLLSSAISAGKSSQSSQTEFAEAFAIAQWTAEEVTNTRAALCDPMGTSLFELATTTSLNIVSSWRRTLAESWSDGSTSTTETKSSTTTDWRTLKFSLSQITPSTIIRACSLPGGFSVNASTAESHFNASLSLLQSIRTLSATEPAISLAQHEHRGAGVRPNLDPCIMARKPLVGTVAENVLEWGTGAINVDGCRVDTGEPWKRSTPYKDDIRGGSLHAAKRESIYEVGPQRGSDSGRWPANLIHDGSDEATGLLDSAARFFYCPKASKADRESGLDSIEIVTVQCSSWENADHKARLRVDTAQSPPRVIAVSGAPCNDARAWNMLLFGSPSTVPCLLVNKSTIETATNSTTESRTLNWLVRSNTSGCTAVASCETEHGGSLAESAEFGTPSLTITSEWTVSARGVERVQSPTRLSISGNAGSPASHPTVKPTDLMRYLCRLVTPPGGVVLDPFAGSGSTGKAAVMEGFGFIGIEREAEYVEIARERIAAVQPGLFAGGGGRG